MGMNVGPSVNLEEVEIRSTLNRIIFRGVCGQKFSITHDDWSELKKLVTAEKQAARKRAKKSALVQALVDRERLTMSKL